MSGRIAATAVTGVVVGVVMVLLDMEPRLVLVGLVVVTVAATSSLLLDLGEDVAAVDWYAHQLEEATTTTVDLRLQHLRGRVHRTTSRRQQAAAMIGDRGSTDQIVQVLVDVIDDSLVSDHGIDRSSDPAGAADVLGADLTRFVIDAELHVSLSRRRLAHIVTLIEQLSDRTPATAEELA